MQRLIHIYSDLIYLVKYFIIKLEFESLLSAMFSMLYFDSLDIGIYKLMNEKFSIIAKVIILSYLCLVKI